MHGKPSRALRRFGVLAMALVLCSTAAMAAGKGEKRLVPVGHTVGVKLFSRGVVVVRLPEGGTPARACGLKIGDVIETCGGQAVTSTEHFQSLLQENGTAATWATGSNTLQIVVTAADGTTTKTYKVTVTKS